MKNKTHSRKNSADPADTSRCLFADARGHRCRMLRCPTHSAFCFHHARLERHEIDAADVGAELASLSGEFKTAHDVNHVLGKLFSLLANKRISSRHAAVLAYIGQLLLYSLRPVKHEIQTVRGNRAWDETLLRMFERALAHPKSAPPASALRPPLQAAVAHEAGPQVR